MEHLPKVSDEELSLHVDALSLCRFLSRTSWAELLTHLTERRDQRTAEKEN